MSHPLRKAAKGQDCALRLFPHCNWMEGTTVLAHVKSPSNGMSMKQAEDWFAVDACSTCHDILDGRIKVDDISEEELLRCTMRAIHITLARRIEAGLIKVKGVNQ